VGSVKMSLLGRRKAGGVLLAIGVLLMMVGLVPSSATAAPTPVVVEGNPKCQDYGLLELTKFESPAAGPSSQDGVTIVLDPTQTTFNWTSTTPIDKVIVKGGPSANVYSYDEATEDTGLMTPLNPGGNRAQISRIDFCYDTAGGPPASPSPSPTPSPGTTPSPTPTPTQQPSPTPSPTRPPGGVTSPSPGVTPSPTSSPGAPQEEIPRTGPATSTAYLLVLGLGLILAGLMLIFGPWNEGKKGER
jgi:hypothetical protein